MLERSARAISTWLIRHRAIEPDDRELYEYAVQSLLFTIAPLCFALLIGAFMGRLRESLVLILPFMLIRKFSGGYHAKRAWICFIVSCGILTLCIYAASNLTCGIALHLATLIAILSLTACSPIDSENRRLEPGERRRYKLAVVVLSLLFGLLYTGLHVCGADQYAVCISVGLLLAASLQLPCLFSRGLAIIHG